MSRVRQIPLFASQPQSVEDIHKQTPLVATFELFQQHLQKEGKSDHTIKAFRGDLDLLAQYTGGDTPVGDYTTTWLNRFLDWMENERGIPCSRKTYARRVTSLKVFFKWLHTLGAVSIDPAKAILQRSGPAPLSQALDDEQIKQAIYQAQRMKRGQEIDTRPELLLRLLLDTGIKKGEVERLKLSDVDRSNSQRPTVMIRHKVRNVYKERRLLLTPEWLKLLDSYIAQYQPRETLFNCTTRNLEYILTDIGEEAGLPFKLSFEVLRWTSAVRDYRAGVEADAIRDKLGLSQTSWHETSQKIKRLAEYQSHHKGEEGEAL